MRERIYTLVKKAESDDVLSKAYDVFIVLTAILSITPLLIKGTHPVMTMIDIVTVYILFADYIFRWIVADFDSKDKGIRAFIKYPFRPLSILDFLSLLPTLGILGPAFRILRIFRIFKVLHYSDNFTYIGNVFKNERKTLLSVFYLAVAYIFISALAIFSYEPDTFGNFFEALYWATVALTTVGYGDVYPVSDVGRFISMMSSFFGIAVIALPAGIVTAGFVDEIKVRNAEKEKQKLQVDKIDEKQPLWSRITGAFHPTAKVKRYALIMVLGVLLNQGMNLLATHFNWPVWLDMTGTLYVTIVLEPAAGLIVALIDSLILAITMYEASAIMYYFVSVVVVLLVGCYMIQNGKIIRKRILTTFLVVLLAAPLVAALIEFWVSGLNPPEMAWEAYYYRQVWHAGVDRGMAIVYAKLIIKTFDTIATSALVALLFIITPRRFKNNVLEEKPERADAVSVFENESSEGDVTADNNTIEKEMVSDQIAEKEIVTETQPSPETVETGAEELLSTEEPVSDEVFADPENNVGEDDDDTLPIPSYESPVDWDLDVDFENDNEEIEEVASQDAWDMVTSALAKMKAEMKEATLPVEVPVVKEKNDPSGIRLSKAKKKSKQTGRKKRKNRV